MKVIKQMLPLCVANLFFSLHYAMTLFINSSYLDSYFPTRTMSLLFVLGSFGSIVMFVFSGELLKRFGTKQLLILLLVLDYVALSGLVVAPSLLILGISFFLYGSVSLLIYYCMDILLENLSLDSKTGEMRGLYLTVGNVSIFLAPIFVSILTVSGNLVPTYTAAMLMLWPVILIAFFGVKNKVSDSPVLLSKTSSTMPIKAWWKSLNIRRVTLARIVLEFFYAVMVIYTPLYLYQVLHFDWAELGVMFAIMLLPFVLFEFPVGIIADKWLGEKEIMTLGFFISGVSLLSMPFIGKTFVLWAAILFISRIGACFTEIATESYFFKHVDSRDSGLIGIFRISRPVATVLAACVGVLSLSLFSFEKIFFVLAIVVFLGMRESLGLVDTR